MKSDPLDALIAKYSTHNGPKCGVARSPQRKTIQDLIDRGAQTAVIERWLLDVKVPIGQNALSRHRAGLCKCGR